MRHRLKDSLKGVLARGPLRALQAARGRPVAVLQYHSVRTRPSPMDEAIGPGILHLAEDFEAQIALLGRTCTPLSMDDLPGILRGERPWPRRGVLVTFDDGFKDNLQVAAPILERYGVPGAFYVTTSGMDGVDVWYCRLRTVARRERWPRERWVAASAELAPLSREDREARLAAMAPDPIPGLMLTWDDVGRLRARGHVVGSHTVSHPNVAHVTPHEALRELSESKRAIEARLGQAIHHFSYPSPMLEPHWTPATLAQCRTAGYETAVTSDPGVVGRDADPLALRRVSAPVGLEAFRWKLETALAGYRT